MGQSCSPTVHFSHFTGCQEVSLYSYTSVALVGELTLGIHSPYVVIREKFFTIKVVLKPISICVLLIAFNFYVYKIFQRFRQPKSTQAIPSCHPDSEYFLTGSSALWASEGGNQHVIPETPQKIKVTLYILPHRPFWFPTTYAGASLTFSPEEYSYDHQNFWGYNID